MSLTLTRAIPLNVHVALEMVAAPLLMVVPLFSGASPVIGVVSFLIGALLLGLAASTLGQRSVVPLSAHPAFDNVLAAATVLAAIAALAAGDGVIAAFLAGFGAAQLVLTASTRWSIPAGA